MSRLVLITGTSPEGLGAETAISLAKANPKQLILAGRSQNKIEQVIQAIKARIPSINISFLQLDLGSQASIRKAVDELKSKGDKIDILINNAAIMACPFDLTSDGVEIQFGTNHIGPFLFTNLLLKANLITHRIVNVSSSASVRTASYIAPHFEDLLYNNGKEYDPVTAYSVSKSAIVLYTRSLAEKLQSLGITAFTLNPGSIKSPLQRYLTNEMREAAFAAAKKFDPNFKPPERKTLQEGCSTQLRAALDPNLASQTGSYLDDCQVTIYEQHTEIAPMADRIWTISEKLVGEVFDF